MLGRREIFEFFRPRKGSLLARKARRCIFESFSAAVQEISPNNERDRLQGSSVDLEFHLVEFWVSLSQSGSNFCFFPPRARWGKYVALLARVFSFVEETWVYLCFYIHAFATDVIFFIVSWFQWVFFWRY